MVMKKVTQLVLGIFVGSIFFLFQNSPVFAASFVCNISINGNAGTDGVFNLPSEKVEAMSVDVRSLDGQPVTSSDGSFFIDVALSNRQSGRELPITISNGSFGPVDLSSKIIETIGTSTTPESFEVRLMHNTIPNSAIRRETICRNLFRANNSGGAVAGAKYSCGNPGVGISRTGSEIINVAISVDGQNLPSDRSYSAYFVISGYGGTAINQIPLSPSSGDYAGGWSSNLPDGDYTLVISDKARSGNVDIRNYTPSDISGCVSTFNINRAVIKECNEPGKCFVPPGTKHEASFNLCKQTADALVGDGGKEFQECVKCFGGETLPKGSDGLPVSGVWTGIGCVPTESQGLVGSLLRLGLGLAGGIVVLMIVAAGFMLATSSGEPNKIKEAKEMVTAAIIGLLFVIFSVIIMRFITVDLLRIPGFGTKTESTTTK